MHFSLMSHHNMGMKYAEDPFNMVMSFDTPIKRLDKLYIKDGLKVVCQTVW